MLTQNADVVGMPFTNPRPPTSTATLLATCCRAGLWTRICERHPYHVCVLGIQFSSGTGITSFTKIRVNSKALAERPGDQQCLEVRAMKVFTRRTQTLVFLLCSLIVMLSAC